jgi:hypothetical protein
LVFSSFEPKGARALQALQALPVEAGPLGTVKRFRSSKRAAKDSLPASYYMDPLTIKIKYFFK